MSSRQHNLAHIHKFSPIIRVVGNGITFIHTHYHHSKLLQEHLKHLQIGQGTVSHKHEELEGPIIHHRNGRYHKDTPKIHHKKAITPLKYKF